MDVWDATNLSPLLKLTQTLNRPDQGRRSALPEVRQKKSQVPEVTMKCGCRRVTSVTAKEVLQESPGGCLPHTGEEQIRKGSEWQACLTFCAHATGNVVPGRGFHGEGRGYWSFPGCSFHWEGWTGKGRGRKKNSQEVLWDGCSCWLGAAEWGREFSTHWAGTLFKLQLNNRPFHHFVS